MSRPQKLAALLVLLGQESAAQILRHLEEHEIEIVISEMTKFAMLSQQVQTEVLREFSDLAVEAGTAIPAGVDLAQSALEKAVGLFRASDIMGRVAPSRPSLSAMQQLAELEARQLFSLLKGERPQTFALILSHLGAEKASAVLALLESELRREVLERLATLGPTPVEVLEGVAAALKQKLGTKPAGAFRQTGGIKSAADLLNALDKEMSNSLLQSIEERNPELGQAIRQKMFTFEDVAALDTSSLQKILREVDMRDLAIALKSASATLKSALLGCISKRAAETVNEEISLMGPVKLREIEAAQMRIIEVVRRLESEGEIELGEGGGKKDEGAT
jgi:flagellar motor switch protein FliG